MPASALSPFDLNLRHCRGFLAVCAQGSVSAAARAVGLSQPALTQAMVKLERQLGAVLFERRGQGMRPTPAALALAPRVDAALHHLSAGARRITGKTFALDRRLGGHQLRAFLSLIETRSFTATADAAGQSVSSAQRAVRGIETLLGKPLLERRGREVVVNAAGRRLARSCRLAMHELQAALSDLGLGTGTPRIALGTTPLARALLVPEAMARAHSGASPVGFQVIEGSWGELVDMLRDGLIDIIVGELPDYQSTEIVKMPLYRESVVIVAGRQHPLASRDRPTHKDLAAYPWIIAPETSPLRAQWEQMFAAQRPLAPVECGSIMVIGRLLTSSHLLTLATPDQVALQIRAGLLTQIGQPFQQRHTIGVTLREGWQLTAAQKDFLMRLQEVARQMVASAPKASHIGVDWV